MEVTASDEPTVWAHKQRADSSDFVRGAAAFSRRYLNHVPLSLTPRTDQFISREWGEDDAGADRVHPRAAFAPPYRLCHDPQRISAFEKLVGVK